MPRAPRRLNAGERKGLRRAILAAVPPKGRAIAKRVLLQRIRKHLADRKIPASAAVKVIRSLQREGAVTMSTRVGIWRGGAKGKRPSVPVRKARSRAAKSPPKPRGTLQHPRRRIRKVTAFVCTRCYRTYPTKAAARAHWSSEHA